MLTNLASANLFGLPPLPSLLGPKPQGGAPAALSGLLPLGATDGASPAASPIGAARGLPRFLDSLNVGGGEPLSSEGVFQLFELQLSVSITQVSGLSIPSAELPSAGLDLGAEATANRIVDFAVGLFDAFAAQNPELSREDAFAQFETVVRDAIAVGIADAESILGGLGELGDENVSLISAIRAAINTRLDEIFSSDPPAEGASAASGPTADDGTILPAASQFGITSFQQVNLNVSLLLAQARIGARGAEALADNSIAPNALSFPEDDAVDPSTLNLLDERPLDDLVNDLFALADDLFEQFTTGEGFDAEGGIQGIIDRILDIFGSGFGDALAILDDFGGTLLPDGSNANETFAFALDSVELNISQTRIETADGLVIEQTSISLRITQIRITGSVGDSLAPEQPGGSIPIPESPEDVAQNVLDFASGLFGIFRAQNPESGDDQALADFVALVRDAAAQGADEARDILDGLNLLDDTQTSNIDSILAHLDELLADSFPGSQLLTV